MSVDLSVANKGNITDIVVDSTGLKVYGEGEWKVRKHGTGKHRTWMKMHLAVDETTQQIQAVTLTTNAKYFICKKDGKPTNRSENWLQNIKPRITNK